MGQRKHYIKGLGAAYDPDYQAILNEASSLGYTQPSNNVKALQNQLMIDLKSNGLFSTFDLLYIHTHDGDNAFGMINWASPSNFLRELGGTFYPLSGLNTASGSSPNSSGYVPSLHANNYQLDLASFGIYIRSLGANVVSSSDLVILTEPYTSYPSTFINQRFHVAINSGGMVNWGGSNPILVDDALTVCTRHNSTAVGVVVDGVAFANKALASTGLPTNPISFGRSNGGYDAIVGLEFLGGKLTLSQSQLFQTIFQDYLTAINTL